MSKKIIVLLAIVVVIGLLMGALYFVQKIEPAQEGTGISLPDAIYVLGAPGNTNRAVNVQIKNEKNEFTVVDTKPNEPKNPFNFTIEGYEDIYLNYYEIMALADRASNLVVQRVIEESSTDLVTYGLDKPNTTIDIKYADNTSAKLVFGAKAPGESGIYSMKDGDPAVYLLYLTSAEYFLRDSLDFVDLTITLGNPQESLVIEAVLGGTVREEEIVIKEALPLNEATGQMAFAMHDILEPIKARLHITSGLEPIVNTFGMYASSVEAKVENADDLQEYGLAEPYSTIYINSESDTFKLLASAPDNEGNCYIMREGVPLVYVVPQNSLPWLTLTPFQIMDKMLVLPFIDTVKDVKVVTPDAISVFELDGEEDALTVTINGQPYEDVRNFRQYYQTLLAASYETYTEDELPENAKPILQFTYSYRNGSEPTTISFYEGAARKVFIQLNDESPMYAISSYVDRVISDTAKIVAGETIRSYY